MLRTATGKSETWNCPEKKKKKNKGRKREGEQGLTFERARKWQCLPQRIGTEVDRGGERRIHVRLRSLLSYADGARDKTMERKRVGEKREGGKERKREREGRERKREKSKISVVRDQGWSRHIPVTLRSRSRIPSCNDGANVL